MMNLDRLFQLMSEKGASDLYLSVGSPVTIKLNGVCVPINQERLAPQARLLALDRDPEAVAHATEGAQRLHATRRTWRSTMHIAYLRGRAALKCP